MNSKIRLLAVASMVAIMASGCSSYRGANQASVNTGTNGQYASGQVARTGQVAGAGRVGGFGQQRRGGGAVVNDSCAACAASKAQSTYTYKPPVAAPAPRPAVVQRAAAPRASGNNQQYYIDRWNRQQAQQKTAPRVVAPKPVQQNTNYAGYGQNGQAQSNTTYYDYSSAARANTPAPAATSAATSNKSIYTGSYQQKTYAPTTYSGGSAAKTATTVAASSGGGAYVVKKGDTVFEIMRQTGVYWKDIISMNNLTPPYSISPGQNLRLK